MSVLAIGDLLFSDLLSELNIKPWWEKLRGYCFAASVASALFLTYIILLSPTTINCTPLIGGNVSSKIEFTTTQASFINTYCSNQIPWYVNHAGVIPLVCTILILVASIWWLHIPGVISAFRTFAIFDKDIENLKLTSKQFGDYCLKISKPDVPKEARELQSFRNTCNLLWKYESAIDMNQWYFKRNLVLLCTTIPSAVTSLVFSIFLAQDNNSFECSLDINDECKIYGTSETMRLQFCSYNTSKNLVSLMIFSSLSIFAQAIFIAIGVWLCKTYSKKMNMKSDILSAKALKAYQYSIFMINFWENARPCGSESLRNFIECMFNRALRDMFDQIENAILKNDNEMISLYSCVRKKGGNDIIKVINRIVELNDPTTSLYVSAVNAIGHLNSIKWGNNTEKIIDFLFKKKYWRLFVHILFIKNWTGLESSVEKKKKNNFGAFIKNLGINTDEIGESHLDSHRPSILHYVPEEYWMVWQPVNCDAREKYIHYDGEIKTLFQVFETLKHSYTNISKEDFTIPIKTFFEHIDYSENKSLEAIRSLFVNHENETEGFENQPDQKEYYIKYQKKIAEELSRFKFPEWNDDTKELAKFLHSKQQWVVFVELLNAYIVDPKICPSFLIGNQERELRRQELMDSDFGVNDTTLTALDANGASILYYALEKPIYLRERETLKNIKFPLTAIHYILEVTKGKEKIVIIPTTNLQKKKISAEKYVKNNQNMDNITKDELLRILDTATTAENQLNEGDNIAETSSAGTTLHTVITVADPPNKGDNIAETSSAGISSPEVRQQSSLTTNCEMDCEMEITNPLLSCNNDSEQ